MNVEVFKAAQEAYAKGDYKSALEGFIVCTQDVGGLAPADLSKFYHLIGNCYVKSNDPRSAAEYYLKALTGSPEKRKPSLYVNLGTALLGTKDYENALEAFGRALDYPIYTTPYKAYAGIGAAQLKLGNTVEAGAAYREAALDSANPAPAKSLINLGVCFMELGRPDDAVSVYETALDFDMDDHARAKAYANLGQAYMAQGRIPRALEVFKKAEESGEKLPSMAEHDFEIAKVLQERLDARAPGILDTGYVPTIFVEGPAEEEDFDPFAPKTLDADEVVVEEAGEQEEVYDEELSRAQTVSMDAIEVPSDAGEDYQFEGSEETEIDEYDESVSGYVETYESGLDETPFSYNEQPGYEYGVAFDFGDEYAEAREPVDMETAETYMPSPEHTAFFDISEQEINYDAKTDRRKERRARGCGLKIAIAFVILCIVLAVAAGAAYVLGFGYPLQETVTEEFFAAVQDNGDTSKFWASDVDESMQKAQEASIQGLTSYEVEAVQRNMSHSEVFVGATVKEGGKIDYEVVLTRNGISWVVEYVQLYFPSEQ